MDRSFRCSSSVTNTLLLSTFKNLSKVAQAESDSAVDTVLRLDSLCSSSVDYVSKIGTKRKLTIDDASATPRDKSLLLLGLPSSDSMESSTACLVTSAKETDEESSLDLGLDFYFHPNRDKLLKLKEPGRPALTTFDRELEFDLQLSLSTGPLESEVVSVSKTTGKDKFDSTLTISKHSIVNQGSVASCPNTCHSVPATFSEVVLQSGSVLSSTVIKMPKSSVTCTSRTIQQHRSSNPKICLFKGCGKGARGASGLCIAHGGGRRCVKAGCQKGAEGRTVYCKAHGGGRRCQFLGCTKSAEGCTEYCIAHGGGRRCSHGGCTKAARGKSGLCIKHGGGKRCQKENCTKSAEGLSGLCISHGGGRRCQYPACTKGAQGSTVFCKAHGGGKRCIILGCTKGAEGSTPFCKGHGGGKRCAFQNGGICPKSVHGGTLFCVAHGGGKRCAFPECTKSARGRTKFCVRHGGGKRCKYEGCGKSAQGSTDFCKAHGGGKRCSWGQLGTEFECHVPCDRFVRGKTGLCAAHCALVHGHQILSAGKLDCLVPNVEPIKSSGKEDTQVDLINVINDIESSAGWKSFDPMMHHTVPPQISQPGEKTSPSPPGLASLPEGRVHGGGLLMAFLAHGCGNSDKDTGTVD